jgi:CDP-diacylglycerol--serine O-phosphatidyltransferase
MTIANGLCGFAAIAVLLDRAGAKPAWGSAFASGRLAVVVVLLSIAMVFDSLDGVVARARGGSGLGAHLDMMCDALTFGVVPPLVLLQTPAAHGTAASVLAPVVAAGYLLAVLVRLAAFAAGEDHQDSFVGLPTPPAAIAVIALLALRPGTIAGLAGVALIGLLMVSDYRVPHPSVRGFVVLILLACTGVALGIAGWLPVRVVAALEGGCALLAGPVESALRRRSTAAAGRHGAVAQASAPPRAGALAGAGGPVSLTERVAPGPEVVASLGAAASGPREGRGHGPRR